MKNGLFLVSAIWESYVLRAACSASTLESNRLSAGGNTPSPRDCKSFLALLFHCLNISSCLRSLLCSTRAVVEVLETNAVSFQSITKIPILVRRFRKAHRMLYEVCVSHNVLFLYLGHVPTENVSLMLFKRDGARNWE